MPIIPKIHVRRSTRKPQERLRRPLFAVLLILSTLPLIVAANYGKAALCLAGALYDDVYLTHYQRMGVVNPGPIEAAMAAGISDRLWTLEEFVEQTITIGGSHELPRLRWPGGRRYKWRI